MAVFSVWKKSKNLGRYGRAADVGFVAATSSFT